MKSSSALSILICVAAVAIAPRFAAHNALVVLWVEVFALTALMIAVGVSVTQRFWGILINERNVMSLSRFQAVLWTVLRSREYSPREMASFAENQAREGLGAGDIAAFPNVDEQ